MSPLSLLYPFHPNLIHKNRIAKILDQKLDLMVSSRTFNFSKTMSISPISEQKEAKSPNQSDPLKTIRTCFLSLIKSPFSSQDFHRPLPSLIPQQVDDRIQQTFLTRLNQTLEENPQLAPTLTPHSLLTSDQDTLDYLKPLLQGVSSEKTFEEALIENLFQSILNEPDSVALILWHRIHRNRPIKPHEWKPFPHLQRLYLLLPLLKNIKIQQLFPDHPSEQQPLSPQQLQDACSVWVSFFGGSFKMENVLYKNLIQGAKEQFVHKKSKNQSFRSFLREYYGGSYLYLLIRKHEVLASHENKISIISHLAKSFKKSHDLLSAAMLDHLQPLKEILSEHSQKLQTLSQGDHFLPTGVDPLLFVTQSKIEDFRKNFYDLDLNISIISLFTGYLCKRIQTLPPLEEKTSWEPNPQHLRKKAAYFARIHSDDVVETEEETPTFDVEQRVESKSEEVEDHFEITIQEKIEHLASSQSIFKSLTPYAVTIAEHLSKTYPKEIGDHLFLMTQGLEKFLETAQKKNFGALPVIFRTIMIDFHVTLEQFFVHQITSSGKENPLIHDLADLAKLAMESGFPISESQLSFLKSSSLALYWARYPVCSEKYFSEQTLPFLLRSLSALSKGDFSQDEILKELFFMYEATLQFLIPKKMIPAKHFSRLIEMATTGEKTEEQVEQGFSLKSLRQSIETALDQSECVEKSDRFSEAITHLKELIHFLGWIEQAETNRQDEPSLEFWNFRNKMLVQYLFKHLYSASSILLGYGDPHNHRISPYFETLEDLFVWGKKKKEVLCQINIANAWHYHNNLNSVLKEKYPQLLEKCMLSVDGFTSQKKRLPSHVSFSGSFEDLQSPAANRSPKITGGRRES